MKLKSASHAADGVGHMSVNEAAESWMSLLFLVISDSILPERLCKERRHLHCLSAHLGKPVVASVAPHSSYLKLLYAFWLLCGVQKCSIQF